MPPLNPILPGFNPDPSICCVGDDFFVATSTFEYFPGVPIYHSTDLINWRLIGHALNRPSQLTLRAVPFSGGVWAPTLRHHRGRFYMTTVVMHGRGSAEHSPRPFFVYTDDIWNETAWSDPINLQMHGIDPDLFFDDDDRVYLCTAPKYRPHQNVPGSPSPHLITCGCEIDIKTGRTLSPQVILRVSDAGRRIAEGPHIYKKDGWYYLITAEGGTEKLHRVIITRSRCPLGPYELPPQGVNPLVFNDDHPDVQCTGHADVVRGSGGRWWAVMLGVRPQPNGIAPLQRETFLAPVEWPENGWPMINNGQPISSFVPADLPSSQPPAPWRDDFEADTLRPGWYHLRTPLGHEFSLQDRPGHLTLYGNGYSIRDAECPSILLRKQTQLTGLWSTVVDFEPQKTCEEAGTTLFVSGYAYIALLLRRTDAGKKQLVATWPNEEKDEFNEIRVNLRSANEPVELQIRVTPLTYDLLYREEAEEPPIHLLQLSTRVLQPQRGLRVFTGPHFGLFSQSNNELSTSPARFDWASFSPDP